MRALIATLVTAVVLMIATGAASARPAGPDPGGASSAASALTSGYTIVFDASKAEGRAPAADVSQSGLGGIDTSSDTGIATLAVIAIGLGALVAGLGTGFMTARHPVHFNRMHLH
jgi:hypothetical protein